MEDTESLISKEKVGLLGGKGEKFCRRFVIRAKPDVCLAVCLRARVYVSARVFVCGRIREIPVFACVCVFIYSREWTLMSWCVVW